MKCNFFYQAHFKIPFYPSRLIISNRVPDLESLTATYMQKTTHYCQDWKDQIYIVKNWVVRNEEKVVMHAMTKGKKLEKKPTFPILKSYFWI